MKQAMVVSLTGYNCDGPRHGAPMWSAFCTHTGGHKPGTWGWIYTAIQTQQDAVDVALTHLKAKHPGREWSAADVEIRSP